MKMAHLMIMLTLNKVQASLWLIQKWLPKRQLDFSCWNGDALSTYFEARATHNSYSRVNASLPMGSREGLTPAASGTYAALAMAKLCWENLQEDGLKAKLACDANVVTESLNKIIETNILLSGLGFESGGLAAAHAIHNGMTVLPGAHSYLHGEK